MYLRVPEHFPEYESSANQREFNKVRELRTEEEWEIATWYDKLIPDPNA